MMNVLVTGGKGQLAHCIKDVIKEQKGYNFIFVDYDELDITNEKEVNSFFINYKISYCVNCAAYTVVDKAESESLLANSVNHLGVAYLANACTLHNAVLIQISTDFVFDGAKNLPYTEEDTPNPISIYGDSKLKGENAIIKSLEKYFIVRTSWLYSEYGHNFLKTMIRLGNEKSELLVVNDQLGSPTYAKDLAKFILKIIVEESQSYGMYHFSNEGQATWYDFAKSIFIKTNKDVNLKPITTSDYPTPAKRPKYSLLDKTKVKKIFNLVIPHWEVSLSECITRLNNIGLNE